MAQILENTKSKDGDVIYPKEPCDKNMLLSSIKSYQEDGVIIGVEKLLTPKRKDYKDSAKANLNVILKIIGNMPKCRLYDLDKDGQYQMEMDEFEGKEKPLRKIDDGKGATVFFPFYANIDQDEKGLDENTVLTIVPNTSSYSFFREGLIHAGELPEDMGRQAFTTTFKELEEAMNDFVFRGKHETLKTSYRSFPSLKCERISDEEFEKEVIGEDKEE